MMTVFRFISLNGCILSACLLLCTVFVRTLKLESEWELQSKFYFAVIRRYCPFKPDLYSVEQAKLLPFK